MLFKNRFKSVMFPCCLSFVEVSDNVPRLPDSVIHEILLKLPVKSVIRCRRVCRGWYHLILDPYFAKVYFNNSPLNAIAITQNGCYCKPVPDTGNFFCIEIGRNGYIANKPLNLNLKPEMKNKESWMHIIGSCYGLICVVETPFRYSWSRSLRSSGRHSIPVCIVNPSIGEYMSLPKLHGGNHDCVVYGFGSTADGEHYKVVKVAMKYNVRVAEAHVLTIGVDKKWRQVDISSMPLRLYSHGVTLNGVLHWVGDGGSGKGVIYAFDILTEKGQCFEFPCAVGPEACNSYLGVWNGNLCITHRSSNLLETDIWTMKRYGFVDSWSKDIVLENPVGGILRPITTMRNGHLLLSCSYGRLFSCDPNTKKSVKYECYGYDYDYGYGYTPNFISPKDIILKRRFPWKVHKLLHHLHNWDGK